MTNHGPCTNCGAPMVKVPFKLQRGKDHPWGLTTWGSELVCSQAHGSLTGALECHYARPDVREAFERSLREPSWFDLLTKGESRFEMRYWGGELMAPFPNTRDVIVHNLDIGYEPCPKKPKQQKRENRLKRALRALKNRKNQHQNP